MNEDREFAPRDFYQVIGDTFHGEGPTPGLALRSFMRRIENAVLRGYPAPTHYLTERRQRALQRRVQLGPLPLQNPFSPSRKAMTG